MGMFDSIIIEKFICPCCKKEVPEQVEVQTKDLHNCLDTYKFPDVLFYSYGPSWAPRKIDPEPAPKEIHVYGNCPLCDEYFRGCVSIQNEILYKYEFFNRKTKFRSAREITIFPGLKELLINARQSRVDLREFSAILQMLVFSVLNGDPLDANQMSKLDEDLKLKVLERYHDLLGNRDFLETSFNPFLEQYRKFHKKK